MRHTPSSLTILAAPAIAFFCTYVLFLWYNRLPAAEVHMSRPPSASHAQAKLLGPGHPARESQHAQHQGVSAARGAAAGEAPSPRM